MSENNHLVCGLDIGTTKIIAAIAEVDQNKQWQLKGFGQVPCRGLRKGVVVDIELTKRAIISAMDAAQKQAGVNISSVVVGVAGQHIRCINSYGIVAIQAKTVTEQDIARAIDAARAVALSENERVLHVLPQEFFIDGQEGIKDPINMSGVRLEVKVHIVVASGSAVQNIINCVEQCNLDVQEVVLEQLASSYAVLTNDEKDLGVCMLDIGGGTADIAVFTGGAIRYSSAVPIAGDQVTSDLAVVLKTGIESAESLKINHASAKVIESQEKVSPELNNSESYPLKLITQVVNARYEELFVLVLDQLRRCGFHDRIKFGLVLTGGGSRVAGVAELAQEVISLNTRVTAPSNANAILKSPECATVVGLIDYAVEQLSGKSTYTVSSEQIMGKVKKWFAENF